MGGNWRDRSSKLVLVRWTTYNLFAFLVAESKYFVNLNLMLKFKVKTMFNDILTLFFSQIFGLITVILI